MDRKIYLIGGAPTTGKSTVAKELSKHLGIPWISTDTIRTMMQNVCKPDDYPHIFKNKKLSAQEFLTRYSTEEIIAMEHNENEDVWHGVLALINDSYPWKSFIVEGIAVEPHLIAKDLKEDRRIRPIFLVDENSDRIREVIFTRGLYEDAKNYADDLKEKEVEWAHLYDRKLREEAKKYGYPCIEVEKSEDDFQKIFALIKD